MQYLTEHTNVSSSGASRHTASPVGNLVDNLLDGNSNRHATTRASWHWLAVC